MLALATTDQCHEDDGPMECESFHVLPIPFDVLTPEGA
jgi:hypothetical protein